MGRPIDSSGGSVRGSRAACFAAAGASPTAVVQCLLDACGLVQGPHSLPLAHVLALIDLAAESIIQVIYFRCCAVVLQAAPWCMSTCPSSPIRVPSCANLPNQTVQAAPPCSQRPKTPGNLTAP
jgi:hypothetical protein